MECDTITVLVCHARFRGEGTYSHLDVDQLEKTCELEMRSLLP
jgi:hypothetical protein